MFCTNCGGTNPYFAGAINPAGNDFFGGGAKCAGFTIQKSDWLHLCCTSPSL